MNDGQSTIDLSIVIPCYNEATRLPRTLRATLAYLAGKPGTFEIIIVSDGSRDTTKAEADLLFLQLPANILGRSIEYQPNAGKGKALKVGMCEAKGERILFMDADYAVPLEYLHVAEALLDTGMDIAIGSRAIAGTKVMEHQSFIRERLSKIFGLIQRSYLGLKLKDTQCGFKLFTRAAAHDLFTHVKLTSVIFDGEVLWLATRRGYSVVEFPVEWTHDQDSRITYNLVRTLKVFWDMLLIPFLHLK
ncbi:MAG: glycosyltransferase family 2 protein [Bacteroidota bacterium]|nr:glycosyltransferase family 2 protein [Bacteroidota bacterium]MDP4232661.1 glycosyltransferase family 2 protein [Bacteroidota bacterium]MDP4243206.1 glycosyltransferase family 2 protein [Bacteroidota bacterium]MDP4288418.1 glycosyltransferase family 2 protein [Bacteroidota bacterium]